jgi:mono/diheme cytochrome c family protein
MVLPVLFLSACSWFTDFKQQPKIDPWETPNDSTPFRGNPLMSVPTTGSAAPGFQYDRLPTPGAITAMAGIANPIPADSASVNRGRIQYQINCAVCHGAGGQGFVLMKYGPVAAPPLGATAPAAGYTDGYLFGIIRNGRGQMPPYNRIEEPDRWDIVNSLRSLQGKVAIAADTSHCRPGETGLCVPGASQHGPTRPAPFFRPTPLVGGEAHALPGAPPATGTNPTAPPAPHDTTKANRPDSTKKPESRP